MKVLILVLSGLLLSFIIFNSVSALPPDNKSSSFNDAWGISSEVQEKIGGNDFSSNISHIEPSNNSVNNCPCCLALCVNFSDFSESGIKFAFQSNYSGVWSTLEEDLDAETSTTYCLCVPEFVWYNHTYYWRVIYNTGSGTKYSENFTFKTANNVSDCPCGTITTTSSGNNTGYMIDYPNYGIIGLLGILGLISLFIMMGDKNE